MAGTTTRGRFVWHELITPNAGGAHDFYEQAVGWGKQTWEHDTSYSMFVAPSGPLGAAVERRDASPHWLAYVSVPDVDAAVATAARLGARVLTPPTDISNAGRHAVLSDPQGAPFAVHSSTMEPSPERAPDVGEFSWHELATTVDPIQAFAFYAELFGWEEIARHDMGPIGVYLIFGRNGTQTGGMFNKGNMGQPGPGYWVCYVRVPDLEAAIAKATAARGSLLHGPSDVPDGDRIAQIMDPHGAFFALHWSRAGAATAAAAAAPKKSAGKKTARVAKPPAKKARKKAPKKAAKKAAKKAGKRVAKKAAKKVGKKANKKRTKRAARKPSRPRKATARKPKTKRRAKKGSKARR